MSEVKLAAEKRTEFGKGPSRRLRADKKVPAVLYGHNTEPVHLALPGHATMMALKQSNALLTIDLGADGVELALPKDVQRNPLRGDILHVDLLLVRRGEKVTVDVALHVVGEPFPGTMTSVENQQISVEVEATHIPESFEVSVEGLEAGSQIHAKDVALPEGCTLVSDPELLVVHITQPSGSASGDDDSEAAEGEDAASEES